MSENLSKPDLGVEGTQPSPRRVHRLVELIAVIVLVGALWWLLQNHPPRGPISKALLNQWLWILVLLVSGWGTAGSLIPYYVGQRGKKPSLSTILGSRGGNGTDSRPPFRSGERRVSSCRASLAWEPRSLSLLVRWVLAEAPFSAGPLWGKR